MNHLPSRIVGFMALLALVAMVVGYPTLLLAIDSVPALDDFAWSRLTSPDDGTLAVAVVRVVAWSAWIVFTASIAVELVARIRGIPTPRVPGLALPQLTAGRLVALASLVFMAVPVATATVVAPPADATAPASTGLQKPVWAEEPSHPGLPVAMSTAPTIERASTPTAPYTVKRGDSLWKIAETHFGDGRRYADLVRLNESVLQGRPDFITPGTVLRVPVERDASSDELGSEYVVKPGDTLSEIAQENLGRAGLHPRIYQASRELEQLDGRYLRDPDLILPGWRLAIPSAPEPQSDDSRQRPNEPPRPRPKHPPLVVSKPPPAPLEELSASTSPSPHDVVDIPSANGNDAPATPDWVLPGLTGAGAVLAGALLLVLRQHRRTQLRYRRPGRIVAPPPPDLRPVEKSAQLSGTVTAPAVTALDNALRDLAAKCSTPPRVLVVVLADSRITVRLTHAAELPPPWSGNDTTWTVEATADFAENADQVAPYPLIVSVGQDDTGLVLLNLEELRSVSIVGEPTVAADLVRHLAAELALNPWSTLVEVDVVGIGAELRAIDPVRLRHHDEGDTTVAEHLINALESEAPTSDPDRYRALLANGGIDADLVRRIAKIITYSPTRSGAAVVTVQTEPGPDDVVLQLTSGSRLTVDALELNMVPAGLSADEAAACAAIVDLTRTETSASAPASASLDGSHPLVDAGGAALPETTEPRSDGPADSLLPLATAEYVDAAATTASDIEQLAPVIPETARKSLRDADSTLDDDLALWFDRDTRVPRLVLLGPVEARAYGNPRAVAKRKPFYVEMLAYLALHPHGVSSRELADAFGLTVPRARTDIGVVRSWLGTDPRSGEPHLPSADAARIKSGNGSQRYQVRGVLVDLDLFRRLRARAQANGSDGIDDLKRALELVAGEPFSHLRPAGWSWLLDGDRLDHIMTCAVADVGHILTTHALAGGNLDLARWSAETSIGAAPYDDVCRLDLITVAAESGHADLAQRQLVDEVLNRSDDGLGPVELPGRTADILARKRWRPGDGVP